MDAPDPLPDLLADPLAAAIVDLARARGMRLATAESCTGGLVAAALTAVAGASDIFEGGFVTYSNAMKTTALGVADGLIGEHGAVSEAVARAMAEGAIAADGADLAVAVTGVAGPGGGTAQKPVGLVWFAVAAQGRPTSAHVERYGNIGRAEVRDAATRTALQRLLDALS